MRIGGVKHCTPYSNVFHYLSTLSNILAIFITSLLALIFFEGKESMWKRHEYRCSDDANLNCFFGYVCCTSGMYLRWFWIYWCAIPPYFLAGDSGGTPWPLWRRLTRDVFLTSSVPGNVQSSVFFSPERFRSDLSRKNRALFPWWCSVAFSLICHRDAHLLKADVRILGETKTKAPHPECKNKRRYRNERVFLSVAQKH